MRPAVKICGLTRRVDVVAADQAGADYVGMVLSAGFSRSVDLTAAQDLIDGVRARPVAVLVDESADRAIELATRIRADVVQLHGQEAPETVKAIAHGGDWGVWKAVRAATLTDLERAVERYGPFVDGYLLEGRIEGVVGGGGAVLQVGDERIVRALLPEGATFVLAGGLGPASVGVALSRFGPDVVDVSSGVESSLGCKDARRVEHFVAAVRASPPHANFEQGDPL